MLPFGTDATVAPGPLCTPVPTNNNIHPTHPACRKEIAEQVTAANPRPIKLKMEKVYHPCLLQTKKRYVGFSYEHPGQVEPIFDAKGIETVR
jgi:hypothetical protein